MDNKKIGQIVFDFLSYVLFLFLLITAFYFILSDSFTTFRRILAIVAPVVLFLLPVVLSLRRWFRLDQEKKSYDFTLYFTQGDNLILDAIMYGVGALIMFLSIFSGGFDLVDLTQALAAVLALAGYKFWLFKRVK